MLELQPQLSAYAGCGLDCYTESKVRKHCLQYPNRDPYLRESHGTRVLDLTKSQLGGVVHLVGLVGMAVAAVGVAVVSQLQSHL